MCEFTTSTTISSATAAASTDKKLYHTTDKLGSAVLVINTGGVAIENNRTLPYGESWFADSTLSTNDKKFTNYQRDQESGLDYAGARFYANKLGHFTSPDRGRVALFLPATLNRYSYVGADPVNRADKTGNVWDCEYGNSIIRISNGDISVTQGVMYCRWVVPSDPDDEAEGFQTGQTGEQVIERETNDPTDPFVRTVRGLLQKMARELARAKNADCLNNVLGGNSALSHIGDLLDRNKVGVAYISDYVTHPVTGNRGWFADATGAITYFAPGTAGTGVHPTMMLINLTGMFFVPSSAFNRGGFQEGSIEMQTFILLHELAHINGAIPDALLDSFRGDPFIKENCGSLIQDMANTP